MNESNSTSFCIVGWWASAVCLFCNLVRFLCNKTMAQKKITITLIEEKKIIWPWNVYNTSKWCHRINMPADTMSIFSDSSTDFEEYIINNKLSYAFVFWNKKYIERSVFWDYLNTRFEEYKNIAQSQWIHIEVINTKVTDIDPEQKIVVFQDGIICNYDTLFLCLGNFPKNNNHVHDFNAESLKNDNKAILWSGLSAVDYILDNTWNNQNIYCISRNWLLPRVQWNYFLYHLRCEKEIMTKDSLTVQELIKLMREELEYCDIPPEHIHYLSDSSLSAFEFLERDIQCIETDDKSYSLIQSILYAFSELSHIIWQKMDDTNKQLFMDKYYSWWMRNTHPMPFKKADEIRLLFLEKKLRILQVSSCKISEESISKARNITFSDGNTIQVPYIFDASGDEFDLTKIDDPFIQNMLSKKVTKAHRFWWFTINPTTMSLSKSDGTYYNNIFIVWWLTRWTYWYTYWITQITKFVDLLLENNKSQFISII